MLYQQDFSNAFVSHILIFSNRFDNIRIKVVHLRRSPFFFRRVQYFPPKTNSERIPIAKRIDILKILLPHSVEYYMSRKKCYRLSLLLFLGVRKSGPELGFSF